MKLFMDDYVPKLCSRRKLCLPDLGTSPLLGDTCSDERAVLWGMRQLQTRKVLRDNRFDGSVPLHCGLPCDMRQIRHEDLRLFAS